MRKQRGGVAVAPKPHQYKIEERCGGVEPVGAVEVLEVFLIEARGVIGTLCFSRDRMNILSRGPDMAEKQASRRPHIAQRVGLRHEAVIAHEPVYAVPRYDGAPRFLREQ